LRTEVNAAFAQILMRAPDELVGRHGVPTLFMSGYAPEASQGEDGICELLMTPFSIDETRARGAREPRPPRARQGGRGVMVEV
jgi:hypothetical protein